MKIIFLVDTTAGKAGTCGHVYTDEYGTHCTIQDRQYAICKGMLKDKNLVQIFEEDER